MNNSVSNAARMFTTRSRPTFTMRSRPMFTTAGRPDFTSQDDQRWGCGEGGGQ